MKFARNRMIACVGCCVLASLLVAAEPKAAKPSSYAPAQDLEAQVTAYLEEIKQILAQADGYTEAKQGLVAKSANTVAAITLVLGMHDTKNRYKPAAAAIIEAAQELADACDDHAPANAAFQRLTAAVNGGKAGAAVQWDSVADIAMLMQQVPRVSNTVKRSVTGRRLRSAERTAAQAATLAAIAQVSMYDLNYCADEEDEKAWLAICADFRSASAELNAAVHKEDHEAAKQAYLKIDQSCKDCHAKFRD